MGDLDILFQGHAALEKTENVTNWLWDVICHHRTALASSYSVYRCIWGRYQASSKSGDLDLLFQGHVTPEMNKNVTDWLWDEISRHQMDIALSNSVYRCIFGGS